MASTAENIVIEERLPRLTLGCRALSDRDHAEEEGGVRRVGTDAHGVPPVVDQPIEGSGRLHLMPPELRQVEGVSRLELRLQRLVPDFFKQGELCSAANGRGRGEAHRWPGHGVIEGSDIKLGRELRSVEGEAAPPGNDAGEIVES